MLSLLFLLSHWTGLFNLREIPADNTCTSLPQTWSVPRGDRIEPEAVMKAAPLQNLSLSKWAKGNGLQ